MPNPVLKTAKLIDHHPSESLKLVNEAANLTLDSIAEAVLRTDIRGNVVFLNRMAEKLTGWSREEALGRPVADVLHIIDGIGGVAVPHTVESAIKEDKTAGIAAIC